MCKFLHHSSRYCIALEHIFLPFTLAHTFSTFRLSLQQMEPAPSQVRNYYSQKNQETHLERALAFNNATNLPCPSVVCLPIMSLCAWYCGGKISLISLIYQDDGTDQQIGYEDCEDTRESTLSSNIEEDNLVHQPEVLHLGQARWDKSVPSTRVPLPKTRTRADTVMARPPLTNTRNKSAPMALPLLQRQNSALLNKLSESDSTPSAPALVLPNQSSGDQDIPQPKASSDQNVPQHQMGTFEVAKSFMEAIVFIKNPWAIMSDDKYSMVEYAWNLAIEAQDCQWALASTPVGTPSVCQLPGGPSFKIDPQTREAVSVAFRWMLLYQTYGFWLPPKIYIVETED